MLKTSVFRVPESLSLPELSESLQSFTGEEVRLPRLEVPSINVSYKDEDDAARAEGEKKGEFVEVDSATKTRKALGKEIVVQILHHRQSLSSYEEKDGVTRTMFTPEVSMKTKEMSVFESTSSAGGKRSIRFLMKGEQKRLRETFAELVYRRILYVLHDGALKSLTIKGASFGKFLELQKALAGKSSSSMTLKLTIEKGTKGSVKYYAICFAQGEAADAVAVAKVGNQLNEWFAKRDALQEQQNKDRAEQAAAERGDAPAEVTPGVASTPATGAAVPPTPEAIAAELNLDGDGEDKKPGDDDLTAAGL